MEPNDPIIPTTPVELVESELTTKQAAERYGCDNYSTFHNRMVKLGIRPERRGRHSFLNETQIQLLDRLDEHLRHGGTFKDFVIEEGETQPIKRTEGSSGITKSNSSSIASTRGIGDLEIIAALQSVAASNQDILAPQKRLKEASEDNFVLTTDQVARIVGLSHSTVSSWKSGTKKLGFVFNKEHEGSFVVWRVGKSS